MIPVLIFGLLCALTLVLVFDAFNHTDMGCFWLAMFLCLPGISHIVYIFFRLYTSRPVDKKILMQRELEKAKYPVTRFPSDIQRAKYIDAASKEHGTMYNPEAGINEDPGGYKHFTDGRAESLLSQQRFEEAFEYLADLLAVADKSGDVRGKDTYRHYINRIPGGAGLLREWETEQSGAIYDIPERRQTMPPHTDDVPF